MNPSNSKVNLSIKGQDAYIDTTRLKITLDCSQYNNFELLAFFKTKAGEVNAISLNQYTGLKNGTLDTFPFMCFDETGNLIIKKLDTIGELYLCVASLSDISKNSQTYFNRYDLSLFIQDIRNENISCKFNSNTPSNFAIIAKIDNQSFFGAKIINISETMDLNSFKTNLPGGVLFNPSKEILLQHTNQNVDLMISGKGLCDIEFSLTYDTSFGLNIDLQAFYIMKNNKMGHINFAKKGGLKPPFIEWTATNKISISTLEYISSILFVANIYSINFFFSHKDRCKNCFGNLNAILQIKSNAADSIKIPLTSMNLGKWFIIGKLDNMYVKPNISNLNIVTDDHPYIYLYSK